MMDMHLLLSLDNGKDAMVMKPSLSQHSHAGMGIFPARLFGPSTYM